MTMPPRHILKITGSDRDTFLQGLVTNDIAGLANGLVYAAMLTPQGKYLADFFLVPAEGCILLDVAEPLAAGLRQRLNMYRLRADVQITDAPDITVSRGTGAPPEGAFADPRHPDLGWRAYDGRAPEAVDWAALQIALGVPEGGVDLTGDSFILEMGFERLNGVDFRKGCYVGQEVTARMKHKTALRKGLAQVRVAGPAAPGAEIRAGDRPAGHLLSRAGDLALAYLRFDRADAPLTTDDSTVEFLQNCGG